MPARAVAVTPTTPWHELPELLTVAEAQVLLRMSRSGAYAAVQSGALRSIRIGSRRYVPKDWIKPPAPDAAAPQGDPRAELPAHWLEPAKVEEPAPALRVVSGGSRR